MTRPRRVRPTPTNVISDNNVNRNRLDNENFIKDKNFNYNIAEVVDSGNSFVDVYVDAEAIARARQVQNQRQRQRQHQTDEDL
ncbi:hypothetical protein J2S74_001763 [Evansella vedderi]|uniref:Uncharacterized protein n=1 Tax=Evansella vedderi TaxID=38282 RepID=A0ABT9ZT21_9BACI|nr:hypothetical protein [Evansella vedderi]MDQ0254388.1 hypothetical protein [Evansella vedderi]